MKKKALFFRSSKDSSDLKPLMECCRQNEFEVENLGQITDLESFKSLLPPIPAVLFLPVIEEDCEGIKLVQNAQLDGLVRVIVLYISSLPSKEYLCLAFREGADDIIALDADTETLGIQVQRAKHLLLTRLDSLDANSQLEQQIDSLSLQYKNLEHVNAILQEQILSLTSTATQLATGQLKIEEIRPSLLIVASSNTQGMTVKEVSDGLGLDSHVVHNGKDALEWIKSNPPQIIITDGTLTDMDATTLAQSARKTLGNKPVIIIAWSSNPQTRDVLLAPETGIDDFVLKSATNKGASLLAASLLGGLR